MGAAVVSGSCAAPKNEGQRRVVLTGGAEVLASSQASDVPRDPDVLLRRSRSIGRDHIEIRDDCGDLRQFVRERARRASGIPGRVLLIGWDGADPRAVEDLLAAGLLPNLQALRNLGGFGRLRSHAPYLSPLLWTSVATGKRPEEHGILDFVEPTAGRGLRPVGSSCRRSTTLWQVASDLGREVLVVNWWASAPADPVRGRMITDAWFRGGDARAAAGKGPETADERRLAALRVREDDAVVEVAIRRLVREDGRSDPRVASLRKFVAETITVGRVLADGLARDRPDLALAYFGLPDQAAHLFVQEMAPAAPWVEQADFRRFGGAVHGAYLLLDSILGDVLRLVPAETAVMLVSDHGFVHGSERSRARGLADPLTDRLHSPEGIYVFAGRDFVPGAGPDLDLYSVPPTVLAALGVPPGADMAAPVAQALLRHDPPATVPTHEVDPAPPPLGIVSGAGCGGQGSSSAAADAEQIERLAALGYLGGAEAESERGGARALPAANLGRALLDSGDAAGAVAAFEEAERRRPGDPSLGFLELEARVAQRPGDAAAIEQAARRWLRTTEGHARPEFVFVLIELLLNSGRAAEARALALEVADRVPDGALAAAVVAAWDGDRALAVQHALRAAAADPVRAVDTVQALGEVFADRPDLPVDGMLDAVARVVPLTEILRAPVGGRTTNPAPTLARARRALAAPERDAAGRLWIRRALAYDPGFMLRRAPGAVASPAPASGPSPATP